MFSKALREYIKNIDEISHVTFDPYGPGVVRIFLIPPKKIKMGVSWVIIINGESILPICMSWAILLREFINSINEYSGKSVTENDIKEAMDKTVASAKVLYPKADKKHIEDDLKEIINTLVSIVRHEPVKTEIGYLSLKEYAKYMTAPHRIDLLISSMKKNNNWGCNQKCLCCYAATQEKSEEAEIGTDEWKSIIDKIRKARIPQITFTGGEPTLRDDLVELVKYSSFFVTRLNTNGRLLTKELCKGLSDASLDAVQVTFYSHKKEIHNLLVGVDGYQDTLNGIKNAIEANLLLSVNTPLCTLNKDYVKTIEFLSKNYGVRYFTCSGLILTGNATKEESINERLTKEELKNILIDAVNYCNQNDLEIKFTSPGWIEESFFKNIKMNPPICGSTISNMAVSPSGDLIPCQSYLDGTNFGSLLKNDFKTLWSSKEIKNFKKRIIDINFDCPLNMKELQNEKNN